MRYLVAVALCASAATSAAQDRPTVLTLPAGARALALGDAFVAGRSAEVIFYNPAMIALQPGMSASMQRYGSSSTSGSMESVSTSGSIASVYALPGGAIGVGFQYLDFSDGIQGVRSAGLPLGTRGPTNSASLAASIALNLPTFRTIRSGVAAKFVEERIGNTRDGGAAFDVGIARDFFGRSTLAISAQNLGTALQIDGVEVSLPTRYTLGASAFAPSFGTWFDASATASVSYLRDGTVVPAGGVELGYVPLDGWAFLLRAGAHRVVDRSDASPLTLGAAISLDRVSLDWTFQPMELSGSSHRIGLRVR